MKKIYIFLLFFLLAGCETTKSVTKGFKGVSQGIIQDLKNTGQNIIEADQWFRENCW